MATLVVSMFISSLGLLKQNATYYAAQNNRNVLFHFGG